MLSSASMRKRSTNSRALVRAMLSFEKYVTAMMVKKTGTVRKKNAVRMLGLSRRLFLKMFLMGEPSWGTAESIAQTLQWRPFQVPIGGLLIDVTGGENALLVEGAATIWKPTGTPSDVTPPGKVSVGWPLMSKGAV